MSLFVARGKAAIPPQCGRPRPLPRRSRLFFWSGFDPVAFGFVASLNRPGGNVTGVASLVDEIAAKRLELLHELIPTTTMIGVLANLSNPNAATFARDVQAAAGVLGLTVQILYAGGEGEIDTALATFAQPQVGALLVSNDPFFNSRPDYLVAQAARHSLPAIYPWREFVMAGGLVSYGVSLVDLYRQAGIYAGHILKGAKPSDLPVERSTKFELVVNLKTAKALGISVPPTLLARADEVIE
jgi:putative tryptophan/tyrosine transport system substrate-binding protein